MIYSIESKPEKQNSTIYEFYRNKDGTCGHNKIVNYKPYFFVHENAPIEKIEGIITTIKGFNDIEGKPLKKVLVPTPKQQRFIKEVIKEQGYENFEGDIPFQNRYTIDKVEFGEAADLKVCYLDIETAAANTFIKGADLTKQKFPDTKYADQPICCLTATFKLGKEENEVVWLCGPQDYPGTRYFEKEEDMLNDFLTYFHEQSPDILTAWNLNNFDLIYIIHRCKRLDINLARLSKILQFWDFGYRKHDSYKFFGTVMLDLYEAYVLWRKYGNLPNLESYSLDYVSEVVLGDNKIDHGKTISYLWKHDLKTLIEYNKQDVRLMVAIDKKLKVIKFFDELRKKCHVQFDDVYKTTKLIDGFLLKRLEQKIILPSNPIIKEGDKFLGAFVFEPTPGVHENILCEDIAGMYPSIIDNFNVSYETVDGGDIVLPLEEPVSFSKETGIIPMFLGELKSERNEYKKLRRESKTDAEYELYDQRQFATKIIMNSFFGYLGYPGARLYKKRVASAITEFGQIIIKKIADWCESKGTKVIYGDTDSVYLKSTKTNKYDVVWQGLDIAKFINKELKKLSLELAPMRTPVLKLEFEKALKRAIFTDAKKRYAYILLWDEDNKFDVDNDLHISGFDNKRSDSNSISKFLQLKLINMIMDKKSEEDVVKYLKDIETKMRDGDYTDEEIGFPKGIKKELVEYNPPQAIIKGATYSNKHFGTHFGGGTKPKFVYIKPDPDITVSMKLFNKKTNEYFVKDYILESITFDKVRPGDFEIDWNTMVEKTIVAKVKKIFDSVGWDWKQLLPPKPKRKTAQQKKEKQIKEEHVSLENWS